MSENDIKLRDGRIVRSETPLNLEMPFETAESFITPIESFYVRTHFPIPKIHRDAWWLHVEGEVEKPFAINYEELVKLESRTMPVTLECAGVPLSTLLDRAVVRSNSCEVILEGADCGMLDDPKSPPGELTFARSIP